MADEIDAMALYRAWQHWITEHVRKLDVFQNLMNYANPCVL